MPSGRLTAARTTGSLYLHCDPTASHYLKLLLDSLFGPQNFRSEIIWKRTSGHSDARGYGAVHDVLLYYVASDAATWDDDPYIRTRRFLGWASGFDAFPDHAPDHERATTRGDDG